MSCLLWSVITALSQVLCARELGEKENLVRNVFACSVLLKVWNFYIIYFIMLTFVSHLTSPKILATINLHPCVDDDKEALNHYDFC